MLWRWTWLALAVLANVSNAQHDARQIVARPMTITGSAVVVTHFSTEGVSGSSTLTTSVTSPTSASASTSAGSSSPASASSAVSSAAAAASGSSSTSSSSPVASSSSGGGLSGGAIAGIVVGVIAAFVLVGLGGYFLARRRKEQERGSATIPHPTTQNQQVPAAGKPGPGDAPYAGGAEGGQAYASVYAPHAAAGQATGNQMSELPGESSAHRATQAAYQQQQPPAATTSGWSPGAETEVGRSELPGSH